MQYTLLGRTGVNVSRIAVGTATFGVRPLAEDAPAVINRALDLGINLFDTSNSYGHQPRFDREGAPPADQREPAEVILGKALKGRRHEVVICTKVMEPVHEGPNGRGLSRVHMMQQIEQSLRRLQTDYVDVYYAHHPDPRTPIDQTLRTFDDLIKSGKVRYCALSTFPGWRLVDALWKADRYNLNAPVVDQVNYNLVNRAVENDVVPVCLENGLSMTVFGPLYGGLLTGADYLQRPVQGSQRWTGRGYTEREIGIGQELDALARESGHRPAHLALSWLFSRPAVATAIIGPENLQELEENCAAADLNLDADLLEKVDAIGKETPISMPR